jgi:hypothetical protein
MLQSLVSFKPHGDADNWILSFGALEESETQIFLAASEGELWSLRVPPKKHRRHHDAPGSPLGTE